MKRFLANPCKVCAQPIARAMTLVEVLAALALLVLLSGAVFGFFVDMVTRRDQLSALAIQQRDASFLFDQIDAALMTAVAQSPDGSAGVKGSKDKLTIVSRQVVPAMDGKAALADAHRLEVRFDERAGHIDETLNAAIEGFDDKPLTETALERVERMRFRYSDGRSWSESFDSMSKGGLPVAVEVSIWFAPRNATTSTRRGNAGASSAAHATDATNDARDQGVQGDDAPIGFDGSNGFNRQHTTQGRFDDGIGDGLDEQGDMAVPWTPRQPDRVRVIVIPDAPLAPWLEGTP